MLYELGEGKDGSERGGYLILKIRKMDERTGENRPPRC
jgi:hypothetical protein